MQQLRFDLVFVHGNVSFSPRAPASSLLSTGPIYSRAITVPVLGALAADLEHQHHQSTRQRGPTSWLNRPVPPPDDLSSDQP